MVAPPSSKSQYRRAARKEKAAETKASLPGYALLECNGRSDVPTDRTCLVPARSRTARKRKAHTGHGTLLVESGFHSNSSYYTPLPGFSPQRNRNRTGRRTRLGPSARLHRLRFRRRLHRDPSRLGDQPSVEFAQVIRGVQTQVVCQGPNVALVQLNDLVPTPQAMEGLHQLLVEVVSQGLMSQGLAQ